jgi:hypothetical protein
MAVWESPLTGRRMVWSGGREGDHGQKKGASNQSDAQETPAKGLNERHLADAPWRGRGAERRFVQRCMGRNPGWRFLPEAVLVAHATFKLSLRPRSRSDSPGPSLLKG